MMIRFVIASVLSLAAAACGPSTNEQDVITRLEKDIELPPGALPLDAYSRYYARGEEGKIVANYVVHPEGYSESVAEFCATIDEAPFPCPVNGGPVRLVERGKSAWVANALDLPGMSGGGCGQVNVVFSPATGTVDSVECNGPY